MLSAAYSVWPTVDGRTRALVYLVHIPHRIAGPSGLQTGPTWPFIREGNNRVQFRVPRAASSTASRVNREDDC